MSHHTPASCWAFAEHNCLSIHCIAIHCLHNPLRCASGCHTHCCIHALRPSRCLYSSRSCPTHPIHTTFPHCYSGSCASSSHCSHYHNLLSHLPVWQDMCSCHTLHIPINPSGHCIHSLDSYDRTRSHIHSSSADCLNIPSQNNCPLLPPLLGTLCNHSRSCSHLTLPRVTPSHIASSPSRLPSSLHSGCSPQSSRSLFDILRTASPACPHAAQLHNCSSHHHVTLTLPRALHPSCHASRLAGSHPSRIDCALNSTLRSHALMLP